MVTFFDIKTCQTYNGDAPFIHWAEPLSVGVIRHKALYFITPEPTCRVHIDMPKDWNFALYQPSRYDGELTDFDGVDFGDINTVANADVTLFGTKMNQGYAYQLIIICRADVEGEFIETFTINGQPFKIGAEFYGENEALKINLANQGTEIPDLVVKSIYGSDLYEDNVDWVLLNRKLRELLLNHMDVMDNKGSYKSLLNALEWFEYQNLVELREVWKFETPAGTKYYEHPLDTFITEEAKQRMFNSAKTTYFALRHMERKPVIAVGEDVIPEPGIAEIRVTPGANSTANKPLELDAYYPELMDEINRRREERNKPKVQARSMRRAAAKPAEYKIVPDISFNNTVYNWDEDDNTDLITLKNCLACKWSKEEMRLKMVLLGNFFEQYFMPIHTDLIRSCIEDIVLTDIPINWGAIENAHEECFTESNDFGFNWSGPSNPDNPDNPYKDNSFDLKEVHVYAGLPQADSYGQAFEDAIARDIAGQYPFPTVPIISCHELDDSNAAIDNLNPPFGQFYNGIGCVVQGNFKFEEPIVSGTCESNQWGDFDKTTLTVSGVTRNEFSIKFLFPRAGKFTFIFKFVGASGNVYTKVVPIQINNHINVDLKFYALAAASDLNDITPNPFADTPEAQYMFTRTQEPRYHFATYIKQEGKYAGEPYYDLTIDESGKEKIRKIIPLQKATGKPFNWRLPYLTKLTTIKLVGADAVTKANWVIGVCGLKNDAWYETLTSDDKQTVIIRAVPKRRHGAINWTPIQNSTFKDEWDTVDAFFPELHTLVEVEGDVYKGFPILCRPVVTLEGVDNPLKYSDIPLSDFAWEFYSFNKNEVIAELSANQFDTLITWDNSVNIPVGKYRATFRYKCSGEEFTVERIPNFRIINSYNHLSYEKYVPANA